MGNQLLYKDEVYQMLNYLRITGCRLGLLVNFGAYPRVDIERYAL